MTKNVSGELFGMLAELSHVFHFHFCRISLETVVIYLVVILLIRLAALLFTSLETFLKY